MNDKNLCHFPLLITIFAILLTISENAAAQELSKGVLSLDELTFDKVARHFRYVLIKFDHPNPYGIDHANFASLGRQLAQLPRDDIIAVSLEVKHYGERDSAVIAKRYEVRREQFPAVRLLAIEPDSNRTTLGTLRPVKFESNEIRPATQAPALDPVRMRLFVWRTTGIRVTLPNCTEDLDRIAHEFLRTSSVDGGDRREIEQQQKLIERVRKMAESSSPTKRAAAQIYLKLMRRAAERGPLFFDSENERIKNLLSTDGGSGGSGSGNITPTKRKELQAHLNVLQSFRLDHYPRHEIAPAEINRRAAAELAQSAAKIEL